MTNADDCTFVRARLPWCALAAALPREARANEGAIIGICHFEAPFMHRKAQCVRRRARAAEGGQPAGCAGHSDDELLRCGRRAGSAAASVIR